MENFAVIELLNTKIPFPGLIIEISISDEKNKNAIAYAKKRNEPVLLLNKLGEGLYDRIGVIGYPKKRDGKTVVTLTKRFERITCGEFISNDKRLVIAKGRIKEDLPKSKGFMKKYINFVSEINKMLKLNYDVRREHPDSLISHIAFNVLHFSEQERRFLLAESSPENRMESMLKFLKSRKPQKAQASVDTGKTEMTQRTEQDNEFILAMNKAKLPANVKKIAQEEYKRMEGLQPLSAEYGVIKNYLNWLVSLPWSKSTKDNINLKKARDILDNQHYGMEKIKNRILEFLAVSKLKKNMKGPIICLVGPPGVGKTSLCRSVATALNRQYHRISLGGVSDESEIRGHRKTYIGSMPGRIVKGLKQVNSNNPLFVLDEIDKLTSGNQGDPTAAMLEVLDPEQNHSFQDHYLEVPFDLSKVMFIATANYIQNIPAPLRDRMEVIDLSGYTLEEKIEIGHNHLLEKSKKDNGLKEDQMNVSKDVLKEVISSYTSEAGVRELKRKIDSLSRYAAKEIVENNTPSVKIKKGMLKQILGKKAKSSLIKTEDSGVVNGLAWTPMGGEVLNIESSFYPGKGELSLSGSLKKVMQESANLAMILIQSKSKEWKVDKVGRVHLHVPSGAIPKDGPSAGITFVVSLMSLIKDKVVNPNIAMTGEISLKGSVLPVGGIKEKILGAYREGIKTVYIPKANEEDLEDIPKKILKEIKVVLVSKVDDILKELKLI